MKQAGRFPTRSTFYLAITILAIISMAGCGEPQDTPKTAEVVASNSVPTLAENKPRPDEKVCFMCQGEGTVACRAPGCIKGQAECPGPCLKLTRGAWVHMNVAGHDPSELWQKFPNQSGGGGYQAWNQNHVGETIVYQNGVAMNAGPCKICGGSTKVTCHICKGTGKQTCEVCQGKKFIPTAWSATDNPWFNSQPDVIRLADGQVVLGRIAAVSGDDNTIVTRDKKILHVKTSDILPKGGTNTAFPTSTAK